MCSGGSGAVPLLNYNPLPPPPSPPPLQGFTRPKVLILLPQRNLAFKLVRRLVALAMRETRGDTVQGKEKFVEQFTNPEVGQYVYEREVEEMYEREAVQTMYQHNFHIIPCCPYRRTRRRRWMKSCAPGVQPNLRSGARCLAAATQTTISDWASRSRADPSGEGEVGGGRRG